MPTTRLPRIAITAGEPAGIGADLCAMLAGHVFPAELTVIADRQLLADRALAIGKPLPSFKEPPIPPPSPLMGEGWGEGDKSVTYPSPSFDKLRTDHPSPTRREGVDQKLLNIHHIPLKAPCHTGQLDPANSAYVLETLTYATQGCLNGTFDAMVTAPVHKGVINDAGIPFTGHTEFLAELTHTPLVVMMLVGGGMRVALATIHMPLRAVPDAITQPGLESIIRILHHDLRTRFRIAKPHIKVAGLNPHAGEGGHLGYEEIEVISPVLQKLRVEGMDVTGPFPADTLFSQHNIQHTDCFLAMYHDQGLAVLKHASFGGGVNVTLGLPIIRTSVDHGTALELAGTGKADPGSLFKAIELAIEIATIKSA